MSKKIMLMSSSLDPRLLCAVEAAKKLGMETVACVREEDNGADAKADRWYAVGADTEKLLEIARKERVDGVIGMWDKTVPAAAAIARELDLPGNSIECVEQLLGKGKFRRLQEKAGVFCPGFFETDTSDGLMEKCAALRFPLIMKPCVCSSSFGQTKVERGEDILSAFAKAKAYSRNGRVCVEEFVEQDSLRVLEAEIFVVGDDIIWDGVYWCWRLEEAPLRPVLDTYPANLTKEQMAEFQNAVRKVLKAAGASLGECDIEGFFTKEGRFFILEINPRPVGYYCQQDVKLFCGIDYSRLIVSTAVGDMSYFRGLETFRRQRRNLLSYAIFSFRAGIFDHVYIDGSIRPNLLTYRELPGGEPGACIEDIHADNRPVALACFGFASPEEVEKVRRNIRELVYVVLREC